MRNRLLLAVDQLEPAQAATAFTIALAARSKADVQVLHVRELSNSLRVPPLESTAEAQTLVQEAVVRLQTAGIAAEGTVCSERESNVARRIVGEAAKRNCDAIILGSLRLRGFQAIMGHGTRERVLKLSPLPVIVTPPPTRAHDPRLSLS